MSTPEAAATVWVDPFAPVWSAGAGLQSAETGKVDEANTAIAATDATIFLKWKDMEPERLRQYPYY